MTLDSAGSSTINKAYPVVTISSINEGDTATLFFGTPFQNTGA